MGKVKSSWPELANTLQILTPPLKDALFHAPVVYYPFYSYGLVLLEVCTLSSIR